MSDTPIAHEIFGLHRIALADIIHSEKDRLCQGKGWEDELSKAESDLSAWHKSTGRKQAYDPESLANARIARSAANQYQENNMPSLLRSDAEHEAMIAYEIVSDGLAEIMIKEGEAGRKLGILELSARLMPTLTFTGSSSYFEIAIVPYGKASREAIGERVEGSFISEATALESAKNLARSFNVHYALAETSAAPREDVPKSGKKPEIYICAVIGGNEGLRRHHVIDTLFRPEFNAMARELMYQTLKEMYNESKA